MSSKMLRIFCVIITNRSIWKNERIIHINERFKFVIEIRNACQLIKINSVQIFFTIKVKCLCEIFICSKQTTRKWKKQSAYFTLPNDPCKNRVSNFSLIHSISSDGVKATRERNRFKLLWCIWNGIVFTHALCMIGFYRLRVWKNTRELLVN